MQQAPVQTLKGFRDFLPADKRLRDTVVRAITEVFELHGFEPLETPTLEYASLLLGKYGDEADKLVYSFTDRGGRQIALRYDQTVPTSRVLSQYKHVLPRFFRRYQIQNVFRADKPQKGRFREFMQCDCDIFETSSPVADAELLNVFYQVYQKLGLTSIKLYINDRETLLGTLSPFATPEVAVTSIVQSIDKLDKATPQEVIQELVRKGLSESAAQQVLTSIRSVQASERLAQTMQLAQDLGIPKEALVFEPTLARGLDYYTGIIFEGKIPEYSGGSVGGGGRYDKLIGELCGRDIAANGFAIGFDRTVEALVELGIADQKRAAGALTLVCFADAKHLSAALSAAGALRQAGIATEVFPEDEPLAKQLKLANQKEIPFTVIALSATEYALKDMHSGEQETLTVVDIVERLQSVAY